jgi:hypothetical protein
MLKTKQKVRKQISDLKMDVEIVNPIESKTIMGGDWYDHDLGWLNITITGGGGGTDFGTFWGNYNDGSTWGNQGGDYYGGGGHTLGVDDYPGEELTIKEKVWLLNNLEHLSEMIDNKNLAEQYGKNQHNGVYDALRHALWSALDAHDLGYDLAYSFHTLHEMEHWNATESPSDLNNNSWGYQWSYQNGDAQSNMTQFLADFNAAVANGEISILP